MKRPLISRSVSKVAAAFALFAAFTAFADEPLRAQRQLAQSEIATEQRSPEPRLPEAKREKVARVASGMLFAFSPESGPAPEALTLTVARGERVLVSETLAVEPKSGRTTVEFLGHHEPELTRLRQLDAVRPGVLRFKVASGARVLADVPFTEAVRASASLTAEQAVGSSRRVDVSLPRPRDVAADGMVRDPDCEADCYDQWLQCHEWCDQRGSCEYCNENYDNCYASCPLVCVEPKAVYEVRSNWTHNYTYNHGQICVNGSAYFLLQNEFSRNVYDRTEHCNGTYTDVYKATEYKTEYCKYYIGPGCIGQYPYYVPNC